MEYGSFREALRAFELEIGKNPGDFFPPDKFKINKPVRVFAAGEEPPGSLVVEAKHEINTQDSLKVAITHDETIRISGGGARSDFSFRSSEDHCFVNPSTAEFGQMLKKLDEARRRITAKLPDVFPESICEEEGESPKEDCFEMECFSGEIEENMAIHVAAYIRYCARTGIIKTIGGGNNFASYHVPPFSIRTAYDVLRFHRNRQQRDELTYQGGGVPPIDADIQIREDFLEYMRSQYSKLYGQRGYRSHDYRIDIGIASDEGVDGALWLCQRDRPDGFMRLEQQWHGKRRIIPPVFPLIATPEDIWKTVSAEVNRIASEDIMKVV